MKLQQVLDIMTSTELKQIVVGEDYTQVYSYLNLALIEVYGKFNILQEEQIINIVAGQTRYRLQSNSQRVLQIFYRNISKKPLYGVDDFYEVPLNDINCDESVFTPQPYVLHIPNPDAGRVYSVMQTVTPPYITPENIDTIDFFLPEQFLETILSYSAYRAYKSMNGDEQSEISSHYKMYEQACKEVYKKGMINYSLLTNTKANGRGFPTARGGYNG